MQQFQRSHAFDNLRAIIMWLGIVLHVSITYTTLQASHIIWKDNSTSVVADVLTVWLHNFRNPIFFILAGFFASLLLSKYGLKGMLKNRFKRIGIPFLVFWPLILVASSLLILNFVNLMETGHYGLSQPLFTREVAGTRFPTLQLWFLCDLNWLLLITGPIYWLSTKLRPGVLANIQSLFIRFCTRWWSPFLLTIPLALIAYLDEFGMYVPNYSVIPGITDLIYNGLFYVFGWLLFNVTWRKKDNSILNYFERNCWRFLFASVFTLLISMVAIALVTENKIQLELGSWLVAFTYNLDSWYWCLACMGLFTRYLSGQNKVLKYISDSSYWVYLIHLTVLVGVGLPLYGLSWPAEIKMLINIIATSAICIITYQLLVRKTFIGLMLNGKKKS